MSAPRHLGTARRSRAVRILAYAWRALRGVCFARRMFRSFAHNLSSSDFSFYCAGTDIFVRAAAFLHGGSVMWQGRRQVE